MKVRLTTGKKRKIFDLYQEVLLRESASIRTISKRSGKFTSSCPAIIYGRLHLCDLERLKKKAPKSNKDYFDKRPCIDSHGKQDIR